MSYYFIEQNYSKAEKEAHKKFMDTCSMLSSLIHDDYPQWGSSQEAIPEIDGDKSQ